MKIKDKSKLSHAIARVMPSQKCTRAIRLTRQRSRKSDDKAIYALIDGVKYKIVRVESPPRSSVRNLCVGIGSVVNIVPAEQTLEGPSLENLARRHEIRELATNGPKIDCKSLRATWDSAVKRVFSVERSMKLSERKSKYLVTVRSAKK